MLIRCHAVRQHAGWREMYERSVDKSALIRRSLRARRADDARRNWRVSRLRDFDSQACRSYPAFLNSSPPYLRNMFTSRRAIDLRGEFSHDSAVGIYVKMECKIIHV